MNYDNYKTMTPEEEEVQTEEVEIEYCKQCKDSDFDKCYKNCANEY